MTTEYFFDSVDDFYKDRPERLQSGEADYGVNWKMTGWSGTWELRYVHRTGEIYATCRNGYVDSIGNVVIVGVVEPDAPWPSTEIYYRRLNRILDGWADLEEPNIDWVRERIKAHAENRINRV